METCFRDAPAPAALAPLADAGITTWADALAWGLAHPAVSATIPATSRPERAGENARVGDLRPLTADEREARLPGSSPIAEQAARAASKASNNGCVAPATGVRRASWSRWNNGRPNASAIGAPTSAHTRAAPA